MPIQGLTTNVLPRFPVLGKIRKGSEKQKKQSSAGKEYETFGKDLKHFRFDCKDQKLQAFLVKEYGLEPNNLAVQLPYSDIDDNFPCWLEDYTANRDLRVRCDGERICLHLNKETMRYSKQPLECLRISGKECNCKEVGRLQVILPKVLEAGYMGYFTLETHSIHDLLNISGFLATIFNSTGNLSGIPMVLSRVDREISTPYTDKSGQAKRTTSIKSLVELALHPELVKKMAGSNFLFSNKSINLLMSGDNDLEF